MKKNIPVLIITLSIMVACGSKVPEVNDPQHIVIDGKPMSKIEFINKYCDAKAINETCVKVRRAEISDSANGKVPRF